MRQFFASNRHWVFAKQHLLGPLNDQLAVRHGAEYVLEVPEQSFDWDVEFSVIKDRSGNTLREQYTAAWVQPSLVAPGDKIYQLGARVNWRNPDVYGGKEKSNVAQFEQNEVSALMAKVDAILGSPIKTKKEKLPIQELTERVDTVTNQNRSRPVVMNSSVHRVIRTANELVQESLSKDSADKVFNAISVINDAKKLNSVDSQQLEVQSAYDELDNLKNNPKTALLGFIGGMICDKLKKDSIKDEDVYDILSRISRQVSDSLVLLGKAPDYKIQAINDIETLMMNLFNDTTINTKIQSFYSDYSQVELISYLNDSFGQLDALRNMALKLDVSDIPAPQVIEKYVEEIKQNPSK